MSKGKTFLTGFVVGVLLCVITAAVGAGLIWKNRYRIFSRIASNEISLISEQFFRALPEGYVTKNRTLVLSVLDEFTNSMTRENITSDEMHNISRTLIFGLEDGAFSYEELDSILNLMHQAAIKK